jgi:hypothetical protein
MRKFLFIALVSVICPTLAYCQNGYHEVRQLSPELCGKPGATVSLPRDFSVTFNQDGEAQLFTQNGATGIHLKYSLYQIEEVCPLPDGRIVVFGDTGSGTSFYILDRANSSPLDTVITYGARMSPDQRWIVYRKFFPRGTELPASDEYLLYDLSESPTQNKPAGLAADDAFDVGTAIYPPGWKNEPFDNVGAPKSQRHGHLSPFFWAPDSRAIVFADELEKPYVVIIKVGDDKAATTAFVRPFDGSLECNDAGDMAKGKTARPTGLRNVEFGPQQATDRVLLVDFEATGCTPKTVQLHADNFRPATVEARLIEKTIRKAKLANGPTPR